MAHQQKLNYGNIFQIENLMEENSGDNTVLETLFLTFTVLQKN
ncbi:MAG: hypothetical protein RLZZ172_1183 [Bacteroidota bacterium]